MNVRKWLDEMEQRNSEKGFGPVNDKWFFLLLIFNSRADIITRYNFSNVCYI